MNSIVGKNKIPVKCRKNVINIAFKYTWNYIGKGVTVHTPASRDGIRLYEYVVSEI